jgi:lipid-binding SYLF domain-containing protein
MRNIPLKAFASPLKQDNKKTKEVKYDLSKATVDGKTKEEIIEENKGLTVTPSFIKPGIDGDPRNYQPKKPK